MAIGLSDHVLTASDQRNPHRYISLGRAIKGKRKGMLNIHSHMIRADEMLD